MVDARLIRFDPKVFYSRLDDPESVALAQQRRQFFDENIKELRLSLLPPAPQPIESKEKSDHSSESDDDIFAFQAAQNPLNDRKVQKAVLVAMRMSTD